MYLKDEFDKAINYLYKNKNLINNNDFILMEQDDSLKDFMTQQGNDAAIRASDNGHDLYSIILENDSIKKNTLSFKEEDNLTNSVIKAIFKNNTGFYSKNEFNREAILYFTMGVDAYISKNSE